MPITWLHSYEMWIEPLYRGRKRSNLTLQFLHSAGLRTGVFSFKKQSPSPSWSGAPPLSSTALYASLLQSEHLRLCFLQ